MSDDIDEDLYGWRKGWEWPWKDKDRTPEKALVGLGRMHDRLMRKYVWVYQGPEKFKPILRMKKTPPPTKSGNNVDGG